MCGHVTLLVLKVRSRDLDNLRAKSFLCLFMYTEGKFKLSLGIEVQYFSIFESFFSKSDFFSFKLFQGGVFSLKVQLHGFACLFVCLFCKSEAKIDCLKNFGKFFLQIFFRKLFLVFFGITRWRAQRSRARVSRQAAKKPSVFFSSFLRKKNKFCFFISGYPEIIPGFFFGEVRRIQNTHYNNNNFTILHF